MKKDLKYFMRPEAKEEEIVEVPGLESIKDDNGNVVPLKIKVLSQRTIQSINDKYRTRKMAIDRKKGRPYVERGEVIYETEFDPVKATSHLFVEALAYPNLKDPELMEFFGCVDITEMPARVFPKSEEYSYVSNAILVALGLKESETDGYEEEIEEAKN